MPFIWEEKRTTSGKKFVRSVASGEVTVADARAMQQLLSLGGELHETPVVVVHEPGLHTVAEARKILADTLGHMRVPFAMVVSSAPARVTLSFMLRISGKSADQTKFFPDEAAATAWIHAQTAN
jgi:hypothetical protein